MSKLTPNQTERVRQELSEDPSLKNLRLKLAVTLERYERSAELLSVDLTEMTTQVQASLKRLHVVRSELAVLRRCSNELRDLEDYISLRGRAVVDATLREFSKDASEVLIAAFRNKWTDMVQSVENPRAILKQFQKETHDQEAKEPQNAEEGGEATPSGSNEIGEDDRDGRSG